MSEDIVSAPSHYTSHPSGIEVIEITKHETFLRGNILKYVLRAPYKGTELQDLRKSRQYLDWEIERLEKLEAEDIDMESMAKRLNQQIHRLNPNHTGASFSPGGIGG